LWNSIGGGRLRKKIKLYYMKHFTILEVTDSESQMIGTILNVTDDASIGNFKSRLLTAIQVHFDTDDYRHDEIPDMFSGSPYDDFGIEIDGMNYEIRIMETWNY
jgi:hypothetical protein